MLAFKDVKIGTRLTFAFSLVLVLLVCMALLAAFQATRLWGAAEQFEQQVAPSAAAVFQFSNAIKDLRRLESQTILWVPDAAELKDLGIEASMARASTQADEALQQYEKLDGDSDDKRNLSELKSWLAMYATARGQVVSLAQASASDPTKSLEAKKLMWYGPSRQAFGALSKSFEEWRTRSQNVGQKAAEGARETYRQAMWWLGSFVLLSLAVGLAAAFSISRSITVPLEQAVRVAQKVAAGDLTSQVDVAGKDETAQLLMSLRDMNAWLVEVVGQVRNSSDHIATGSAEIASGNADLSQRTETQASNLQQTAASMEELTSTVSQSADTALEANRLATSASKAATQGGLAVDQVVTTMADIAQSSKKIADIIGVIDGIAFQTNILALNAAVEAARAGEQGRGFAVVASEVRSLAQRSASAAKEIKTLINDSVEKVNIGNHQVSEAGQSMGSIVAQVQRVSHLIGEISAAASEQTLGIAQVSDAVNQLDQVTQQNAALVEQSAAAAESLKRQASHLSDVVGNFKLHSEARVLMQMPV